MESAVADCHRDGEEVSAEPAVEAAREFLSQLELSQGVDGEEIEYEEEEEDEDEEDEEEEEFSFVCPGDDAAQIAAEDAFFNGQIRPVYPLFNRDLLLGAGDFEGLDEKPPVENVFVETGEVTSLPSGNDDDGEGLSCEWSGKAVAASGPDGCKKSNSTGFSKFWRFRDLLHRSNSDGRDAFVFLNNPAPSTSGAGKTEEKSSQRKKTDKVKVNGDTTGEQKKKSKKQLSAHERYMKSKAKDEDRRRSYLPYRPELVGFFTNVKGGLTRNVHPF